MKLGKILFPIFGTISVLTMTGLSSCENKKSDIPFNFSPDIENIIIEVNPQKSSYAGWNALMFVEPIIVSKKNGEFSQTEHVGCYTNINNVNYESIQGQQPKFQGEYIYLSNTDFSDGKYILSLNFVFTFLGEFPESSFKLNYEWNYDFIFQFKATQELLWKDYKIENCTVKGTIDYVPSEEK